MSRGTVPILEPTSAQLASDSPSGRISGVNGMRARHIDEVTVSLPRAHLSGDGPIAALMTIIPNTRPRVGSESLALGIQAYVDSLELDCRRASITTLSPQRR